jgi:FKBP-type peptidyl-prolyl cis-trans isomerase
VYYVGRLKHNNKQFDSTTQGSGFKFRLGRSEVIKGWDIGVTGMKVGGKRKIVCPPALAYVKHHTADVKYFFDYMYSSVCMFYFNLFL